MDTTTRSRTLRARPRWSRIVATVVMIGVGIAGGGLSPTATATAATTGSTSWYNPQSFVATPVGPPIVHTRVDAYGGGRDGAPRVTSALRSSEQTYRMSYNTKLFGGHSWLMCRDTTTSVMRIDKRQNRASASQLEAGLDETMEKFLDRAEVSFTAAPNYDATIDTDNVLMSYDAATNQTTAVAEYEGACNGNIDVVDRTGRVLWGTPTIRKTVAAAASIIAAGFASVVIYGMFAQFTPGFYATSLPLITGIASCVGTAAGIIVTRLITQEGSWREAGIAAVVGCAVAGVVGRYVQVYKTELKALAAALVANTPAESAAVQAAQFGPLSSSSARVAVDTVFDEFGNQAVELVLTP